MGSNPSYLLKNFQLYIQAEAAEDNRAHPGDIYQNDCKYFISQMPHWGIVTSPVTVSLRAEVFNHVNRNKDVTCLDVIWTVDVLWYN